MQATRAVRWPASLANASAKNQVTHVLDFGPGGTRGAAALTRRVLADRMEQLPVILATPFKESDGGDGVYGLDVLMGDTAAAAGARAHWASATIKATAFRRVASAPVLSGANRPAGMRKGTRLSVEKRLSELDATKVSLADFGKLAKSKKSPRFRDRQVTFVVDS